MSNLQINPVIAKDSALSTRVNRTDSIHRKINDELKATVTQIPLVRQAKIIEPESTSTYSELRSKFLLDLGAQTQTPPVALEIVGVNHSAPIAIYGGLTLLTAKAKAGKTYAHSILVSALIRGSRTGKIVPYSLAKEPNRRKVVVFYTEQSSYHAHKVGKRIELLAGTNIKDLEVWKLRTEPNDVKLSIINTVLLEDRTISAIVIDGARDLGFDINDVKESSKIVSSILKWAEEFNIAIIVILHQNKNDTNARGHLGTELKNKAEIICNVTKHKDAEFYSIEAEDCRDREFEPISFRIGKDGLPVLLDEYIPSKVTVSKNRSISPEALPQERHLEVLKLMFQNCSRLQYKDVTSAIKEKFKEIGVEVGKNKAVAFLEYYQENNLLMKFEKVGKEKWPTYGFKPTTLTPPTI